MVVVSVVVMDEMLLVGRIEIVVLVLEVRHYRDRMFVLLWYAIYCLIYG